MAVGRSARHGRAFPVALLLALAVTAFGQAAAIAQVPAGGATNPAGAPEPAQAPENPAAIGANPKQNTLQNMADHGFVRNTMRNDETQIRLSQLAEQKTSSPDVKQFSQQMVKVHTELDTQLKPVAARMGANEPRGPSKEEKKEIEQLQRLSEPQFDAAYLEAMAREQRQSLKLFRDETEDTGNQALLQAAKVDTPVLAQNLQILQQIAQSHNVEINDKEKP